MVRTRLAGWASWGKRIGLGLFLIWTTASTAAAQCVMCYASASNAGSKAIQALRSGILVLVIPTALVFGGIMFIALRHRKFGSNESDSTEELPTPEPLPPLAVIPESRSALRS